MPGHLLSLLAVVGLLGPDLAHAARPSARGGYSIQIEDAFGRTLPTFGHRGATYVLGEYDSRYNVRVHNHTGRRVEAVVTVDGRDAISGAVGDFARQRGYIVPAHGSVLVEGFRQSHSAVAAFRFTPPGDSYSGRMGTPQHTGVVGVAIFKERHRRRVAKAVPRPRPRRDHLRAPPPDLDDASGAAEATPSPKRKRAGRSQSGLGGADYARPESRQNLGTRYGESRHSPVVEVPFQRARSRRPNQILAVYYDDASGLASRGISVYPRYSSTPNPFPQQFAPPPPY